jgi:hypothetical protein
MLHACNIFITEHCVQFFITAGSRFVSSIHPKEKTEAIININTLTTSMIFKIFTNNDIFYKNNGQYDIPLKRV